MSRNVYVAVAVLKLSLEAGSVGKANAKLAADCRRAGELRPGGSSIADQDFILASPVSELKPARRAQRSASAGTRRRSG